MATDAERGFTSRFRKTDRFDNRRDRGERRTKALDQNENTSTERETTDRISSTVSSRPRHGGETTNRGPGTVAARISRLKLDDEIRKEKENEEEEKEVPKPSDTKIDSKTADAGNEEDDESTKKPKERGASATTSKKRQQKKNLREKRRSTGVVIMPSTTADDDEETKQAKENAVQNEVMVQEMSQSKGKSSRGRDGADEAEKQQLVEQLEAYQQAIQEWRDEFDKAQREIELLRNENQRLRDENSALVKVVNQLSGGSRK